MTRASAARACALALAIAAVVAGAAAFPGAAGAAPLARTEFASRLAQVRSLVAAQKASPDTTAAALTLADAVDAALPSGLQVVDGTGTVQVDLAGLRTDVRTIRTGSAATTRRDAAGRLLVRVDAMRAALGSAPAAADPADPGALARIVAALPNPSSRANDWLDAQIQKFLEWLARLLGNGPAATPGSAAASRITMIVVLALPVLLALIVLVRALLARRRRATAGLVRDMAPAGAAGPAVAAAADLPADALGYAEGLAAAGAHREAVRALYGGAARHLVEEGAVSRMRTRTNREMLRDVSAAAPALAAPFESLTGEFERAWYGHADPGPGGFARARTTYEVVVSPPAEVAEAAGTAGGAGDDAGSPGDGRPAAPAAPDGPGEAS